MSDNKDIILGSISSAVSSLLGSSAAALMKTAGARASHRLWPELPTGKNWREAGDIMSEGVRQLGGFGDFAITGESDGVVQIEFRRCFFAGFTGESGHPCGEQAICFFGFGLVEETYKRLTGNEVKVELTRRDDATETCHETITLRRKS